MTNISPQEFETPKPGSVKFPTSDSNVDWNVGASASWNLRGLHRDCFIYFFFKALYKGYPEIKDANWLGGEGKSLLWRWQCCHFLAYSHFPMFLHSKKHLVGQKFHEDEEVKHKVTMWLCRQAVEFYDIVMNTHAQAKQMPWQKWWLCGKIAKDMCYFSLSSLIKILKKIIAFVSLLYGCPIYLKF